jgi:hypothetical protein
VLAVYARAMVKGIPSLAYKRFSISVQPKSQAALHGGGARRCPPHLSPPCGEVGVSSPRVVTSARAQLWRIEPRSF